MRNWRIAFGPSRTISMRVIACGLLFALCLGPALTLPAQPSSSPTDEKLISLAYFLIRGRPLQRERVRAAAEAVFGERFRADNPRLNSLLYPYSSSGMNSWVLRTEQGIFVLNSDNEPYMSQDETDRAANSIEDPRLSQAVRSHRAWLSFDFLQRPEPGDGPVMPLDESGLYRYIARFMAEMAADDVLAIYAPEMRVARLYETEILIGLRGERPLSLFAKPDLGPVITVRSNHPFMLEALADARDGWADFKTAFANRPASGPRFVVKAEFEEDGSHEAMWIIVESMSDGLVRGELANSPVALSSMKRGDKVSVPETEITDWMYRKNGEDVGGFTRRAIDRIQKWEPNPNP